MEKNKQNKKAQTENLAYNISFSLIKAFDEVESKERCPLQFYKQYITKEYETEPTEPMRMGQYLEYLFTGQLPRSKEIPQPKTTKTGLSTDYQRIVEHKERWEDLVKHYKITDIVPGIETVTLLDDKISVKTVEDVRCKVNGKESIIDIKCSGLIRDKWQETGWEEIERKPKLYRQGFMYCYNYKKTTGILPDFYFAVFSPKSDDYRLIQLDFVYDGAEEIIFEEIENKVRYTKEMIDSYIDMGFHGSKNYSHCKNCGIENCAYRQFVANIEKITISKF